MAGRPINERHELAVLMGDKTYFGSEHDKCGTFERYTKGGGCVHCARVIASEQRAARKFLQTMEAQKVEGRDEDLLDTEPKNGLSAFEQSIEDDLM